MKASETILQRLLDGKIQYRVPLFQRTYDWDEKNWQRLWDDILDLYSLDEPKNHFIGSMVTQPISDAPERAAKHMLIDGQQRLTTLLILLAAIRSRGDQGEDWLGLAAEITTDCLTNQHAHFEEERFKLRPTQRDRAPFASVMNGEGNEKSTRIGGAYAFFLNAISQGDLEGKPIDLSRLRLRITHHLDLVSIKLEQGDSPNRIFESLNNTGVPLEASDLIRNYLFMMIPGESQQEAAHNRFWYPMQEKTGDRLDDFFWRYSMMNGQLTRQDETFDVVKELLEGTDATSNLERFHEFSLYYRQVTELETEALDAQVSCQIERLNKWEVDVSYPFLMRVLKSHSIGELVLEEVVDCMKMIESFVVRRAVCAIPTNRLRRVFVQMATQVDLDSLSSSTRTYLMANEWPGDDEFHEKLITYRMYVPSRLSRTRLMLDSIEKSFGHKETPELDDLITVEHIMPQTLTETWRTMIGAKVDEIHFRLLHTIGNLTLSGYNPELGNRSFLDKERLLGESNFALSKDLKGRNTWDESAINDRADHLARRAVDIWSR